ncbi:hypothetical protein Acr_08g0013440 [Actinidia rufa]|uniref:Uncharacterized protein n=1 Tax=Actinidia rufa TaxID=165716 RepID=A0A7J0F2M1_9ERIC|nr:hypothetical protein Acr_08g0013440 [Actinidia rufa]
MSFSINLGSEESEQSLPSWISDHLGAKSYIDETNQSTSSPPILTNSSKMDTSSLNKESNVMSQAELDNLGTTYSFPQGVRLRIPGDGETILSARQGEVAFYEAAFLAGLRCLYSLSPLPDSGWYYFKARPEKNLLRGSPSNVKGWKTRDISRLAYSALSTSGGDNTTSGDEGEFGTGEDSVEYLGVIRRGIRGAIRRALPGIPDETLLRWLGGSRGREGKEGDGGGVVIREKRTREGDLVIEIGEEDSLKGKETVLPPPPKRFKSNRGAINARGSAAEAGTSSPAGDRESESMSDASVARRLLTGVIPASDKKEVDQLSENDLVAKSFHALGQEHLHDIDCQMARADSAELELVKAQKRAVKAETQLAELNEEISRPGTEVDVAELTSKLAKAKELAIEDFKASEEFKAAVTDSAATYFGDGFEFCKRQLLHQFPNLGADVANMAMDPSFAEEEEATKEGGDHV